MKHTIIIAEAGVNHNGSPEMARRMIREAAAAGADYVKFQTFRAERLVSASAKKADYQRRNCGGDDDSQLAMLQALELSDADFAMLAAECRDVGIGFMSTPFDMESIDSLSSIGMDYWKIPSGEITNLPYLRKIASKGGKAILSTGMSTMAEAEAAVAVLEQAGIPRGNIIVLHCTTQYPAPLTSVNLLAMNTLRALGCAGVGYSDHTEGITVAVAAAAMGAVVVEKHFTLDRSLPGPDHKASLTPPQLKEMVDAIRAVDAAMGTADKAVTDVERPNIAVARKSIVAAREIQAGEMFTEDNLTCKRPGTGLSPMKWDEIIGKRSPRAYAVDEQIEMP